MRRSAGLAEAAVGAFARPVARWLAMLLLCSAYLQGGFEKAADFPAAMAEMRGFGLSPAGPFAVAVIALALGGFTLVLTGFWRWAGALALGGFTLCHAVYSP